MAALDQTSTQRFEEEGYLVVENLLDVERGLGPVVAEYTALLDDLMARWHAEGKLPSAYRELPFGQRLVKVIEAGLPYYQHFDVLLPQANVTLETPMHAGPAVFRLLRNRRLLDAVGSLIGPEIYSNPVQHVRIKPPERVVPEALWNGLTAATAWHQDQGVVLPEADESEILTVWLPLTDATEENGCIPDRFVPLDKAIPLPMKRGSVLFMHRRTMHASLPNGGDGIRWSFDLRYNPTGQPTGRPAFPGFVARSRRDPASELRDPAAWADLWRQTQAHLAEPTKPAFNRWRADLPVCA